MAQAKKSLPKTTSKNTKPTAAQKASGPTDPDLKFYILKPNKTRREWAIQAYKEAYRGSKRDYQKSETDIFKELALAVKPVNLGYQSKLLSEKQAMDMLKEIISNIQRRQGIKEFALRNARLSRANESFLAKFWDKKYAHKNLVSPGSALNDFHRALRLAGDISLYTAGPTDFKENLEDNCKDNDQYRRAVVALNELLKFAGRDFALSKPEEEYKEVDYLTEAEVKKIAESAPNHVFKLITYTLFGTGCRTAEIYGITPDRLGKQSVHVVKQLPRKLKVAEAAPRAKKPKRGKQGWVGVIGSTWKYVQEWAKYDKKEEVDRGAYYMWLSKKSRELWPDEPRKQITPHDLRHSHAIHLLSKELGIIAVARNLRNRVEICQKYYSGHEHTPESLDSITGKI